jgi:hypothetical protein
LRGASGASQAAEADVFRALAKAWVKALAKAQESALEKRPGRRFFEMQSEGRKRLAVALVASHSQYQIKPWEAKMVLQTTGASWLALIMRAERTRGRDRGADTAWLLYGPDDPEAIERELSGPEHRLAAE